MKARGLKTLKIALIGIAILLVVFLITSVVLILAWPWWVGVFLGLLLAGLWFGFIVIRKIWWRRREENFVTEMVEHDTARIMAQAVRDRDELRDLHDRWKSAINRVRTSHLKKLGNPLYVLPWYMVIGDSGSGKTTLLNSARLASPYNESVQVQAVSGTKQCEWYFFEQSIIIDTAGRYSIPANAERDKAEWQKFLALLLKYRRREPLNGLIVTIAADRLLTASNEELEADGLAIRKRIDELMRALGVRVPVYALVTKCDLINGVNRFCERLPEKSLMQPMGIMNHDLTADVAVFLAKSFSTMDERLRRLRLQLLHEPEDKITDAALLLFPEECARLNVGLRIFMLSVFSQNPYQETPFLRGLYFSSGRQEGSPHSSFSAEFGILHQHVQLPGTSKGLFLHDFFASILPKDRALLAPTRRAMEWHVLTGNLGLTSWVVVGVALCGLLSFSFMKNIKTIRDISAEFSQPSSVVGESQSSLASLVRLRTDLVQVEARNRNWWIPRFGLRESIRVEQQLKYRYCRQFKSVVLAPTDRMIAESIAAISTAAPDDVYGHYVVHTVRRINLLRSRQDNVPSASLAAMPQPSLSALMSHAGSRMALEPQQVFGALYLSYVQWRADNEDTSRELASLFDWLKRLVVARSGDLRWVTTWTDVHGGLSFVTLQEFWGGSRTASEEPRVLPSYTKKGKHHIAGVLAELQTALSAIPSTQARTADFDAWYRASAFAAWRSFVSGFPQGVERLQGRREWQAVASGMAGERGPYFALLNRVAVELEPLLPGGPLPAWLQQVYCFQAAKMQGGIGKPHASTQAKVNSNKFLLAARKSIGRDSEAQLLQKNHLPLDTYKSYRAALSAITPATASRNMALQLAAQTFGEDPISGKSPFNTATASAAQLHNQLSTSTTDDLFRQILQGPLDFLWAYVRQESACQLQALWEEQVLAPTMGMTPQQAMPLLVGPDGLAWRFVKGPAAPFLKGTMSGYGAKDTLGGTVPLHKALFAFLGKGGQMQATVMALGRPQNFSIGIRGLPTDANTSAMVKPHATRLDLQCGGSTQSLVNYNYPVSKTFSWSPESCSDAILQIEVGDLVLSRHYMGQDGFSNFIKDMRGGRRTFFAREFPGERRALDRMGITTVTVNYRFVGSGSILKQTATLSGQAPRSIAQCWTR
jgi:type VI secretion system protein ImpL